MYTHSSPHELKLMLILEEITEDPKAKMQWKLYWRNVVQRYRVMVEGWPAKYPFKNLSDVTSSLVDLEDLLRKWQCGAIHWRKLSEVEFTQMNLHRDQNIENGTIVDPAIRRRRSDCGQKRRRNTDPSLSHPSKKQRSRSHITDEDNDSASDTPANEIVGDSQPSGSTTTTIRSTEHVDGEANADATSSTGSGLFV
jgi:hypothetical protein